MQMQLEIGSPYIKDLLITDMGFGGGFALWGIRTIASGHGNCRHLSVGFNRAFSLDNEMTNDASHHSHHYGGTNGRLAINVLKGFSHQISSAGKRKILLSGSGCMRMTPDEASLVAALAAAQRNEKTLCTAHLEWLLVGRDTALPYAAAQAFGAVCLNAGISINAPDTPLLAPKVSETQRTPAPKYKGG